MQSVVGGVSWRCHTMEATPNEARNLNIECQHFLREILSRGRGRGGASDRDCVDPPTLTRGLWPYVKLEWACAA
eukprot:scaffold1862_cov576-Prasinococcus_capsulatus_cf.AAC.11